MERNQVGQEITTVLGIRKKQVMIHLLFIWKMNLD